MTTQSLFGVAGPFTCENPLRYDTETQLLDKVRGTPIVLPAGNIVTDIQIQQRGDSVSTASPQLTAGKSIAVGVAGDPRAFTGMPGALTDDLRDDLENGIYFRVDQVAADTLGVTRAYTTDKNVVIQCAMGEKIESGSVAVVVKFRPYSKSVAKRHGTGFML